MLVMLSGCLAISTVNIKEDKMTLFKTLTPEETIAYEKWAEENRDEADRKNIGVYHPVITNYWEQHRYYDRPCVTVELTAAQRNVIKGALRDRLTAILITESTAHLDDMFTRETAEKIAEERKVIAQLEAQL